jgi:hypothetical protein
MIENCQRPRLVQTRLIFVFESFQLSYRNQKELPVGSRNIQSQFTFFSPKRKQWNPCVGISNDVGIDVRTAPGRRFFPVARTVPLTLVDDHALAFAAEVLATDASGAGSRLW